MSQTVYIDTSVIGGAFDEEFEFWTSLFFQQVKDGHFKMVISDLLEGELLGAPTQVVSFFETLKQIPWIPLTFGGQSEHLSRTYKLVSRLLEKGV